MLTAEELKSLFETFSKTITNPFVVLDERGKLVAFNSEAEQLFNIKESSESFADLFLISEGIKLKHLISGANSNEFSEPLSFYLRNGKEITVNCLVQNSEIRGFSLKLLHFKNSSGTRISHLKVSITKKEIIEMALSPELELFLQEIESSYPLTYLAKSKIQTKADSFSEMVWLKDSDGKYVLVNDKYATHMSLKTGQMEGRPEKNFIPHYIYEFYSSLEKYLRDSLTVATLVTDKVKGIQVEQLYEIIEIPLLDLENNLAAVIGIARPTNSNGAVPIRPESQNNLIFTDTNNFSLTLESILKTKNKMYEFIVSKNPDAVFIYDLESFKFLDVNAMALNLYGYSRQEFLQMDLTDLYLPDEIQTIADSAKHEEGKFLGPFNHRKKDGNLIQVEICRISFNYEGSEAHFNIIRDITSLLEKEEQLQMMRTVFEYSQDILIVTDNTGFISYVNPVVEKYLGYKRTELLNNSIVQLANESSRNDFIKKSVTPNNFIARIKNSSGVEIETEFTSVSFAGVDGAISQIAYIGKLIAQESEPKVTVVEKEVEKIVYVEKPVEKVVYIEKKSHGNHEIKAGGIDPGQLSFIFHEILTPINVIVGFIAELKDTIEVPTDDQAEAISIIDENRKKLLYTMDSISEYAQIEQHFGEIKKENFSLDLLLDKVFKEIKEGNNPWKKVLVADRISTGVEINSDEEKVVNLICLIIKILSHVSEENELYISGYQLDETHFIVTFRDHSLKIQQKLLYLIQGLFSDSDVSKLRAFGVSRFTIFSAQRLFKLLDARFEIIQKMGTPFDIGLILSLDAQFQQEVQPTEEEKEKVFKPALTAEKISISDSEFDHLDLQQPRTTREFGKERLHDDRLSNIPPERVPKVEDTGDYRDFDFDSELDFLTKRRKKEQERKELSKPKSSFDESLSQRDIYTETPRRRDTQEITGSYSIPAKTQSEIPENRFEKDTPQRYDREKTDIQPPQVKRNEEYPPRPVKSEPPTPIHEEKRWEQRQVPTTPQPEPEKVSAREQTSEFRDATGSINLSGMSCLYIEDQLDSQILFKVQMKDMKSIKFAQSFEDAIPLLESEKFDFIVLDINLQGEYNGLDALKIIRTMDRLEEIPILAVTAYVLPGDKEKFIATGFTDFVSKPIFRNKMVEVLSKIF